MSSTTANWQPAKQFWMLCRTRVVNDIELEIKWLRLLATFPITLHTAAAYATAYRIFGGSNIHITAEAQ